MFCPARSRITSLWTRCLITMIMPPCMITDPDMNITVGMSVLRGMNTLPDTIMVNLKTVLMKPLIMDHMTIAAIMP